MLQFSDYSIQFSPDSHDEKVRYALGRRFDNSSMEKSIISALANGCRRVDIFFMIGLPEQTIGSSYRLIGLRPAYVRNYEQ